MNIVIVEDDPLIRGFLHALFTGKTGHQIAGEAATDLQAIEMIRAVKAELVLLDLYLPDLTGFSIIEKCVQVMKKPPRILIYSGHCDAYVTYEVERHGVLGFVNKPSDPATLMRAFDGVTKDEKFYDQLFLYEDAKRRSDPNSFDKMLTDREMDVLKLVSKLKDDVEIAKYLGIAKGTVEKHRITGGHKLDLNRRVSMERYARDHGFPTKG